MLMITSIRRTKHSFLYIFSFTSYDHLHLVGLFSYLCFICCGIETHKMDLYLLALYLFACVLYSIPYILILFYKRKRKKNIFFLASLSLLIQLPYIHISINLQKKFPIFYISQNIFCSSFK